MTIYELREKRISLGISQQHIGKMIGVSGEWLGQCELGRKNLSKSALKLYEYIIEQYMEAMKNLENLKNNENFS